MPSRASARETCPRSVGRSAPPPSRTRTLHTPHVPCPPHAEGMKIFCSASVPRSVPPACVEIARASSSFTTIRTSPDCTSLDLAIMRTTTSIITMIVNATMPATMVATSAS